MPDITMCSGDGCPIKTTCYRHTARPTLGRQSWFVAVPWDGDDCEHYYDRGWAPTPTPLRVVDAKETP